MTDSAVGTGATSEPVPAPGEGEDIIAPSNRPTGAWSPAAWVPRASFTRGGDGRPVTAAWAPTCLPRPQLRERWPVAVPGSNRLPKVPTRRAQQLRFRHQPARAVVTRARIFRPGAFREDGNFVGRRETPVNL